MITVSRIRRLIEDRYLLKQKKRYPIEGISIISQNCIGGILYHRQGARFLSPTIGCAIRGENFVKLCENIGDISKNDCSVSGVASISTGEGIIEYPLLSVCGVTVDAIHYDTPEEAQEKWNERRKRIDYRKTIVLATTWDLQNDDALINRIVKLTLPKLIFTDLAQYKNAPGFLFLDRKYKRNDRGTPTPFLMNKFGRESKIVAERFNIYKLIYEAVNNDLSR